MATASGALRGWRSSAPPTTPIAWGLKLLSTATSAWAVAGWTSGAHAVTQGGEGEGVHGLLSSPAQAAPAGCAASQAA